MKNRFSVVEKDGRFHLYEGDKEYLTPCLFPISSCDKGLVEAYARKLGEGKPNVVMLYLRKYDNLALVKIIKDLASADTYSGWYKITNNSKLCAEVFKNIQLRRLVDAYSACGSMGLVTNIAARDVEEDYDDFFPGMALTSGISASPYDEEASFLYDMLCDHFDDQCDMDVSETLSTDYLADFVMKYNAILVPKGERARRRFSDLLDQLELESDPEDDNETSGEEEDLMAYIEKGDRYLAGDGVEKNVAEAVRCYATALAAFSAPDPVQSRFDDMESKGIEVDLSQLMQKATAENDLQSQYLLGNLHCKVKGACFDIMEGFEWFKLAAEGGHPGAQVMLGQLYCAEAVGDARDVEEGKKWLAKAMEQHDDAEAAFSAALLLALQEAKEELESDGEEGEDDAEERQRIADRMAQLDAETLRKFNIVRDFVSKYDDFWADFEDCDAVYRPFFHSSNVMRFWFNPPYDENGDSYPCESDKVILTKKGEIYVEDHGDGEFYNILDCVPPTLDNAVEAIESHVEDED